MNHPHLYSSKNVPFGDLLGLRSETSSTYHAVRLRFSALQPVASHPNVYVLMSSLEEERWRHVFERRARYKGRTSPAVHGALAWWEVFALSRYSALASAVACAKASAHQAFVARSASAALRTSNITEGSLRRARRSSTRMPIRAPKG